MGEEDYEGICIDLKKTKLLGMKVGRLIGNGAVRFGSLVELHNPERSPLRWAALISVTCLTCGMSFITLTYLGFSVGLFGSHQCARDRKIAESETILAEVNQKYPNVEMAFGFREDGRHKKDRCIIIKYK